ncbi:hypothetical protein ES319_A01G094300v1 [Gossypium barbadense]|uniref:Cwf15/Cwc15 cell cycle control protein n=1 Tax=Gossypium barbadense TaxID=3634 RepID=A0A5J5WV69_GOSBA|nr:hypothetical protein ES319_A01G094300v1 [Gossypium barbadense]
MTTAARPTWQPAKDGQDTQDELQKRNLRAELEERERRHFSSKDKSKHATNCSSGSYKSRNHLLLEGAKRETEDGFVPRSIDADDSDVEVNSDEARWDDDVVFKNQVRGETKPQKCFIKDTIRNDFHRKFLLKYIK